MTVNVRIRISLQEILKLEEACPVQPICWSTLTGHPKEYNSSKKFSSTLDLDI